MLVKGDLRSTKNELLEKYYKSCNPSVVCQERLLKANAFMEFYNYVFLISLCEMLLIPARVFSEQFFKEK